MQSRREGGLEDALHLKKKSGRFRPPKVPKKVIFAPLGNGKKNFVFPGTLGLVRAEKVRTPSPQKGGTFSQPSMNFAKNLQNTWILHHFGSSCWSE